jgi:pyruvate/2-oxoglutarate dehydrogenase complex dihydrolipoamide dehydrogenase (E3) component
MAPDLQSSPPAALSDLDGSSYDVIVVGAGPVGENVVDRVANAGLSCAVVEAELAGGECSYWACIPSKALLKPIGLAAAAARLPGVRVDGVDPAAVLKRRDYWANRTEDGGHDDSGAAKRLASVATFIRGWGRLSGEKTVTVEDAHGGTATLTANQAVVLSTGSVPSLPPIPGLREAKPWGSREVTNLATVPERVIVLGGGVVAVESADALRGLGAEVTLIVRGDLLTGREPWAGELLGNALRAAGVDVWTGVETSKVARADDGTVTVTFSADTGEQTVTADVVVAALGRHPNTQDIGVDVVGLEPGKAIEVDDSLRSTSLDWLYATGDVNGRVPLTHQGKYQARICADVIVARSRGVDEDTIATDSKYRAYADERMWPQVVFTDPQVCSVGLTEAQAREQGFDVRVVEYDIGFVTGASIEADGYTGKANIVVDESRHVLLGATFVGQDTAELLHSATIAVVGEVPIEKLWHAVPSFPTISEVWLRLLEAYGL